MVRSRTSSFTAGGVSPISIVRRTVSMVAGRIARTFSSESKKRFLPDAVRSSTSWTIPGPFPRLVREKHMEFLSRRAIEASSLRLTKINGRSRASMLFLVLCATNHVNPASARVPIPTMRSPAVMSGVMLMKATLMAPETIQCRFVSPGARGSGQAGFSRPCWGASMSLPKATRTSQGAKSSAASTGTTISPLGTGRCSGTPPVTAPDSSGPASTGPRPATPRGQDRSAASQDPCEPRRPP
jgi:hypothetical protein